MKLGPVLTTTKNSLVFARKYLEMLLSYQFSIFVTLFTLEAHERFQVTKNNWSCSQNKVTQQEIAVTKNKGFCCLTKIVGFQTLLMVSLKFIDT